MQNDMASVPGDRPEIFEVEVIELDLREDLFAFRLPCCGCGDLWSDNVG